MKLAYVARDKGMILGKCATCLFFTSKPPVLDANGYWYVPKGRGIRNKGRCPVDGSFNLAPGTYRLLEMMFVEPI